MRKFDIQILQICPPHLTAWQILPLYLVKSKKSFLAVLFIHNSDYLCYLRRKLTVIYLPTPPKNVTALTCELQNFFYLTEGLLRSFKRWRLWRQPVVGCHRWFWKEPVVMCGNCNVRQATSQQVFRVTTFCINIGFPVFFDTDHLHSTLHTHV